MATTQEKRQDDMHVGRVGSDIFIGVTDGLYEMCQKPLTKATMHAIRFSEDDARWLIDALLKELESPTDGN